MQDGVDDLLPYTAARGTIYTVAQTLLTSLSSAIFFMLVARFLPNISDYGLINGLQVIIIIASVLGVFGLTWSATRFIPYHIGAGDKKLATGFILLILTIGLISSTAISFALYFLSDYVATIFFHNVNYRTLIRVAAIDVFINTIMQLSIYILYSFQEFKKVAIFLIFDSLLKFSAAFALMILGIGVIGFVMGLIIGDAISLIIFVNLLKPYLKRGPIPFGEMRSLFNYTLPLFGAQILTILSVNVDYYLILILSGLYTAGLYSPSVMIGNMLILILGSFEQTIVPYFSRMYGRTGGIEALNESSELVSRYIFLIYVPIGFATLVCLSPLIIAIFGDRYFGSVYASAILILAITLTSVGSLFNYILMSAGYSRIILKGSLIALPIQFAISITTIPSIGGLGAAFARASSYAIMATYSASRLKQMAGLHYDRNAFKRGIIGSVVMASIIFSLNLYLHNIYYILPLDLLVGFIVYIIFLRFTNTMNKQDFRILNAILAGKLKRPMTLLEKIVIR